MAYEGGDIHAGIRQALEVLFCILPVPVNGWVAVEPREVRTPHGRRLRHHRKGRHAILAKQLRSDALGCFPGEIGLSKMTRCECVCMSIKRGHTIMLRASMTSPTGGTCGATSAILPSRLSTSAAKRAAPVPSIPGVGGR